MPRDPKPTSLEEQIDRWRSYLRRRQAIHSVDVAELEDHLREQVAVLVDSGLTTDEAFLVAVKRMGKLDTLSREFAREHSDRLWKQLVVVSSDSGELRARARTDAIVAFSLAVAAAVLIKVPALFGIQLDQDAGFYFYARNLSLFVLPLLTGYFVWKRRLHRGAYGAAPADRALVGSGHRVRGRPVGPGSGPHGLHPVLGRAVHLLCADRPRRRRPLGVHEDHLPVHRDRRRALLRVVAAAVRSCRGRRGRLLAGGGQAKRDREHGARVDAPLHTLVRRRSGHVSGDPAVDRTRSRHREERAHRLRPAPGGGPWPSALFRLRP